MSRMIGVGVAFCLLSACADPGLSPGEGYVEVDGGRVWYRIVGSGRETPLLLLHGGPGAPSYYLGSLDRVAAERPVIFYDQLGAGRSDRPADLSLWRMDRFIAELVAVREALGLDEVHLYGHSWGAMLALDYMMTEPDGVRSLILASPVVSVLRFADDAERLIATLPEDMQEAIRVHGAAGTTDDPAYQAATAEYYKRYLSRADPWSPDLLRAFEELNADVYGYMWGPTEFAATGTLKDFEREDVLPKLDLPVLFTAGRYDESTPESLAHFHGLVPGAEIAILENSAHMTMLDEPEANAAVIRDFLNGVEGR